MAEFIFSALGLRSCRLHPQLENNDFTDTPSLKLAFKIINPLHDTAVEDAYWCILTRLDSFKISMAADTWEVGANQEGVESSPGSFERIRCFIGNHVHAKEKVEEASPTQADMNAEIEETEVTEESDGDS